MRIDDAYARVVDASPGPRSWFRSRNGTSQGTWIVKSPHRRELVGAGPPPAAALVPASAARSDMLLRLRSGSPLGDGFRVTLAGCGLLLGALFLGACGRATETAEQTAEPPPSSAAAVQEPVVTPQWATPTEAELLAERQDSISEAELFRARQASMEGYEACMARAKQIDPAPRAVIEAGCARGRAARQSPAN
jgi:hypothetical protein